MHNRQAGKMRIMEAVVKVVQVVSRQTRYGIPGP